MKNLDYDVLHNFSKRFFGNKEVPRSLELTWKLILASVSPQRKDFTGCC